MQQPQQIQQIADQLAKALAGFMDRADLQHFDLGTIHDGSEALNLYVNWKNDNGVIS